jgi:4-amino-4-deoxy-L-arabinose transferase-like glycosyltransferase
MVRQREIVLILLVGAFLRFHALTEDVRFHPDEALFATFARNAAVHGDWMLFGALDKTPLSIYAAALSMHFIGVYVNEKNVLDLSIEHGEFAARLPNVLEGIVLIALVYALGISLFDRRTGLFAALLVALSPQLISFSATAFTDTLMLFFMVASLLMAARGRPLWSGLWLGLAVWAKQQGIFYLPLVLWILVYSTRRSEPPIRPYKTLVLSISWRFLISFLIPLLLLFLWDSLRTQTSLFALAAANNNPERFFVRMDELLPRLSTWLTYASTFVGTWWMTLILTGIAVWGAFIGKKWILPLYIVAYFIMHTLIAFNTYDRYLLPLIPLLALLASHGLSCFFSALNLQPSVLLALTLLLLLILPPIRYPTDIRARDSEITELADYLNAKPLGTIIYDHWLGWEMGYYIGAWSDKRRVYYPDPQIQAEDALLNPDLAPRYFIVPLGEGVSAWLKALREKCLETVLEYENTRYRVYQVILPGDALCTLPSKSKT